MYLPALAVTCACLGISTVASAAPSPVVLVEKSEARAAVYLPPGAPEALRAAVADLTRCLKQMSGATLEVREYRPGARGIVIGAVGDLPDFRGGEPLKGMGPEGLLLRTEGDQLWLVGNTSLGAQGAVYVFLDKLGCRWLFPGAAWEVIPSSPTVRVGPWDEAQRPSIDARRIWYGFGTGTPTIKQDYENWVRRNRLGGSFDSAVGHAWEQIVPQELFAEHPEWFAEVGGTRKPGKLCPTHPAVIQRAVAYARDYFHQHPDQRMVSLSPSDGLGFCECACAAEGSVSDQVFTLVNTVARAIRDEFPDKLVGCYAYSAYSAVPKIAIEPNVYVQVAAGYIRAGVPVEELVERWGAKARQIGVREYYSVWQWDWDHPDRGRANNWAYLRTTIPFYQRHRATSLNAEASNNWGAKGLGYYLAARLMWDVNGDTEAWTRDFLTRAFEGAAPPMERFYRRWSAAEFGAPLYTSRDMPAAFGNWKPGPRLTAETLALSFQDLSEAAELARSNPAVQARIDLLRMYLHFLKLSLDYDAAPDGPRGEAAAEALVRFAARIMDTHMIHAQPLLNRSPQRRLRGLAPERVAALMPGWRERSAPPEHAELERLWAADWEALKSSLPARSAGR